MMDSHHSLSLHNTLIPPDLISSNLETINKYLGDNYSGRTSPISFVAFLCGVIRREVIDKVGLLDVNYEMGMWDDNDYNLAARKAGYRCELAIDTCIYHKGRSTFNLIQKTEGFDVNALLYKNQVYMDKKWNLGKTNYKVPVKGSHVPKRISWREKIAMTQDRSKIKQS